MHKFALGKSVAKLKKPRSESRAKMVDDTFAFIYNPVVFFVCKCEIYRLCLRFTSQFLHLYDIFARNKFEILFFFVQSLVGQMPCKPYQSFSSNNGFLLRIQAQVDLFVSKGFFLGEVIMFTSPFKIFAFSKNRIKKKKNEQPPKFGTL